MNTWYTADLHLGHNNLARMRGYNDTYAHDAMIIDNINRYVQPKDRLFIVGDFAWKRPQSYRPRIACKQIVFIRGNHDTHQDCLRAFGTVHDIFVQRKFGANNEPLIMCHYPMAYWDRSHYGSYHVYGHMHSNREATLEAMMPNRRALDVGVDNAKRLLGEYRPFAKADILALLDGRRGHDDIAYYQSLRDLGRQNTGGFFLQMTGKGKS